jgi:hypothetical protein
MARIGHAWRFSTAHDRSRVVFVSRECDSHSEVYCRVTGPNERTAREPLTSGGRRGLLTVDRRRPDCRRRGASAVLAPAVHTVRPPQAEGECDGEADHLNCSKPSPDSTALGGLGLHAQCLVGTHVPVER